MDMSMMRMALPAISKIGPTKSIPFAVQTVVPLPWYTKWWIWALVGGGVLVTGVTAALLLRRRKPTDGLAGALSESAMDFPAFEPAQELESSSREPFVVPSGDAAKEKRCGCKVKLVSAKGGSKRYAAVCGNMSRYISAKEAKEHGNKEFCKTVLKPFTKLSGRAAADRMWAKKGATRCTGTCAREG